MSNGLIPGSHVREHDDSFFSAAPGLLHSAVQGTAKWGPFNTKQDMVSPSELVSYFGKPESTQTQSAMAMIRAKMSMTFVRIGDGSQAKSAGTITNGTGPAVDIIDVEASYEGTQGDHLKVVTAAPSDGVVSKVDLEVYLYDVLMERFIDVDSFVTAAALNSEYVGFSQNGSAVWPSDWSASYATFTLSGGDDGDSAPDMTSYYIGQASTGLVSATGMYLFEDVADDEIDLLLTPGVSNANLVSAGLLRSEDRQDCVYCVDGPDNLDFDDIKDWHNGSYGGGPTQALNSSYGVFCYPWLQYYDEYSNSTVYIPPSAGFAIAAAQSWAANNHPYVSPAGYEWSLMPEYITGMRYSQVTDNMIVRSYSTDGQNINWFKKWTGYGITLWGQKTLYRTNSALNRMNVRFTTNAIKRRIKRDTRNFAFKNNEAETQARLKGFVSSILEEVVGRGISQYTVICDETVNTAAVKERNQMVCRIYYIPLTSAEWLFFDIYVSSQSASI